MIRNSQMKSDFIILDLKSRKFNELQYHEQHYRTTTYSNSYQNASAISNIHDASLTSYHPSSFQSNIELFHQQSQ